ncbi:hypothetical protein [Aquella oligotrophica]|uniref:Uncharacterized protein n=1 Tax=Aquella oligotrophica TaxID=2067065 RepID=A0A2I7N450_9NEIS|nr:hypothetical protein [Aquella oligotrophica]AUR51201.1 hypothetical protein CUN60_02405 [Aquella oligotrophica]
MLRKILKWRNNLWLHMSVIIIVYVLIQVFDKYLKVDYALELGLIIYLLFVLLSFFVNFTKYYQRRDERKNQKR